MPTVTTTSGSATRALRMVGRDLRRLGINPAAKNYSCLAKDPPRVSARRTADNAGHIHIDETRRLLPAFTPTCLYYSVLLARNM